MTTCAECGFDWTTSGAEAATAIRSCVKRFRAPLTRFLPGETPDQVVRRRPGEGVWSPLEYAAHMRDVLSFYDERVSRVLEEERPQLAAFGFESACEERRYNDDDPEAVADAIATNAERLANRLEALEADQWQRAGLGSEGDERDVLTLARRAAHEGHHHLLDIGRGLRAARERR